MMRKNLYIFTSKGYQPSLYINIIGSCFTNFGHQNIEDIFLLKIDDGTYDKDENGKNIPFTKQLKRIRKNIELQVTHLSNSQFLIWDEESKGFKDTESPREIKITESQDLYHQIHDKISEDEIRIKVIKTEHLENNLSRIINNPSYEFIFDLTGIQKKDFVSISLVLLSKGSSIYILEVHKWFTHDENDLIHNLLYLNSQNPDNKSFEHHHLNPKGYVIIRNIGEDHVKEMKKKWRDLIAENKREKAINEMKDYLDKITSLDNDLQSSLVNASSRYVDSKERLNKNIISKAEYDLETNRITHSLLEIISRIE